MYIIHIVNPIAAAAAAAVVVVVVAAVVVVVVGVVVCRAPCGRRVVLYRVVLHSVGQTKC